MLPLRSGAPATSTSSQNSLKYPAMTRAQSILAIFTLSLIASFLSLGSYDLSGRDEIRRGLVVQTMDRTDDWVIPRQSVGGKPYLSKPPLYYWHALWVAKAIGGVNEWALRLPSAFGALVCALCLFALARSLTGDEETAFLASAMFLLSPIVLQMSRMAKLDMTLAMYETIAVTGFYFGLKKYRRIGFAFTAAALGACFLAKGPIGIITPGVFMILWLWRTGQFKQVFTPHLLWQVPLMLAVAAPWYYLAYTHMVAEGLDPFRFFYHETGQVLLNTYAHKQPMYYFFYQFPAGHAPWSLLFLSGLFAYWKQPAFRTTAAKFALLWFLPNFFFFSLSSSKQAYYLLPLYPAAALLSALVLKRHWQTATGWFQRFALPLVCLGLAGMLLYVEWELNGHGLTGLALPLRAAAACCGVAAVLVFKGRGDTMRKAFYSGLTVAVAGLGLVALAFLPLYTTQTSIHRVSAQVNLLAAGLREVYVFHTDVDKLPFYCIPKVFNLPTETERQEMEHNLRKIGNLGPDETYNTKTVEGLLASGHRFLIIAPASETNRLPMHRLRVVGQFPSVRNGDRIRDIQSFALLSPRE